MEVLHASWDIGISRTTDHQTAIIGIHCPEPGCVVSSERVERRLAAIIAVQPSCEPVPGNDDHSS
jgi:hypothetical protein